MNFEFQQHYERIEEDYKRKKNELETQLEEINREKIEVNHFADQSYGMYDAIKKRRQYDSEYDGVVIQILDEYKGEQW